MHLSVLRNETLTLNPESKKVCKFYKSKGWEGIIENLQEDSKLVGQAYRETHWERGRTNCRLLGLSCRDFAGPAGFPSPPPDPTESFNVYCSSLKHFAAITSVMRDLLVLLNLLRCSFEIFLFPPSFCSALLQVSKSQCAGGLHMRRSPLKCQPKSAPHHLHSTHPFLQLSENRMKPKTRSDFLPSRHPVYLSIDPYPPLM